MNETPDLSKMPELPPGYKWTLGYKWMIFSVYPRDLFLYSPHEEVTAVAYWEFDTRRAMSQKDSVEVLLENCTLEEGAAYIAQLCWMGEL